MSFAPKPDQEAGPWDVVMIGSGPASLTAAIYTTRGASSTLILGGEKWGGQLMLTTMVDNYPGFPEGIMGPDLMQKMRQQAERFGAEFFEKNAVNVDFKSRPFKITSSDNKIYLAKSVILATGASTRWLRIPGEQELIGRGVAVCAPCDAPFYKDKKVAVVGGGDSAMEEALVLTKYANQITIIHRRDEFRASEAMQQKALGNPKIKILWNTEVVEVVGKDKAEKIILKNSKDGTTSEMLIDGIFVAIGHKPESDLFKGQVEMDERGYIKVFNHTKTSVEGVFVAGELHDDRYKQAITTAGFGCMAALDALKYLDEIQKS